MGDRRPSLRDLDHLALIPALKRWAILMDPYVINRVKSE